MKRKIMNYYTTFKFDYTDVKQVYHLLKSLKQLQDKPVFGLEKPTFDFAENKTVVVQVTNGLGKELKKDAVIYYKIDTKEEETKPVTTNDEDNLDLEDPTEEAKPVEERKVTIKGQSKFELNLDNIDKPGKYKLTLRIEERSGNSTVTTNESLEVQAVSKVKLNHLVFWVTDTQGKRQEKDVTIEYPKRSFKSLKVTHNNLIHLKIKVPNH
jgi:hypothetical protein